MPTPRDDARHAARRLARSIAESTPPPGFRVVETAGRVACMILVWDADGPIPTLRGERRAQGEGRREGCKADILAAVADARRALTRKDLIAALKAAGKKHGRGTVAKALADLTADGRLVNTRDKRGYRLPEWVRRDRTPSLF